MTTQKINDFQDLISSLENFWINQGCTKLTPYDAEMGAGTFHPATALFSLNPKPFSTCYVQPSRRPTDGRYGESPNRLQHYFQFQVVIKPVPNKQNITDTYLKSLQHIGIDINKHDIRFVEDDWKSPTLGASGLGWEIWCDGMEITQFTYFQEMGGISCPVVAVEITYGLERLAMYLLEIDNVYNLPWNAKAGITYGDIFLNSEKSFSHYNFSHANVQNLVTQFKILEEECNTLIANNLVYPAYHCAIKASNVFNLLDARGVISVAERELYISKIRNLVKQCCNLYVQQCNTNNFKGF